MKNNNLLRVFRSMIAFILVLSLVLPFTVNANAEQANPFKSGSQSESTMQLKAAIAEQLNLANGGPILHKDLQGLSGDERVNVIVHLSENPVALKKGITELAGKSFSAKDAREVKQKVVKQQNLVQKEMASLNISHEIDFSYNTVLNGFSTSVKADDLEKILLVKGVTLVEPDATVYAFEESNAVADSGQVDAAMATSIDFLGIEPLWAEGYEGQGIKVAVLDTGIDADHPDFEGIYKGGKNFVLHTGNDYARPRAEDDASETSPLDRPNHRPEFNDRGSSFYTSHGTHVAGTIAAIGANEYGIKGIAPKVDLYAYRVLGAYGSGSTSGIIAAIDYAVEQEIDVINLSLGGGANSETDGASFAINNAMIAGTISVIATGNSGPNRGTMGTPATSRLGIAVGNTTNPEAHFAGAVTVNAGDFNFSKTIDLMGTTFGQSLAAQLEGEFELVAVPGIGAMSDYEGLDVDGKVALVSRGQIAFVDKIEYAKENGAVAIIVHNFAGGTNAPDKSNVFLGDAFEFIPAFDMSQTDGDAIRAALAESTGTVTFGDFNHTMTTGDDVNDSSSRGPSSPNFDIKPDVSAPGTNIMSTIPMYKADFPEATYEQAYTRKTGTSMATPHIAGIAALVKQANPTWNAFDVKVALSNTAKLLDTTKYDVFAQGAGRVQAYAAAHPEILAYAIDTANNDGESVENLKGTVTFGPQSLEEDLSVTKQILVKDIAGNGGNYNVTVDVTKSFGDAKVTVNQPSFTLDGELLLDVTLTGSSTESSPGDEILGYIHISNGAEASVSLPFAADFGGEAPVEVKDMDITETDLSFDGDGFNDEAMLYFTITGDVGFNVIELWDIMNPEGGEFSDGYIGYLHAGQSLGAGSYQLPIKGQYRPWDGSGLTTIPDGLYTVDFTAETVSGNPAEIGDYAGPIFVKTTKPVIEGSISEANIIGKVTDKYIEYIEELALYGLDYDLNEKLSASYVITKNDVAGEAVPFLLNQDGSFDIELPSGTLGLESDNVEVSIIVEDAAGNKGEALLTEDGKGTEVTLSVDKSDYTLAIGNKRQIKVTETTTEAGKESIVKDVTNEATYEVANEEVVSVVGGEITALASGSTTVTVKYLNFEPIEVKITVTAPVVVPDPITPPVDPKPEEKPDPEVPGVTPPVFTDITNTFAAKEINKLAAMGIIQGKTETEFAPNAQISRAEFAVLLARALDLELKDYEGTFSDVNTSKKWAFAGVEAAARAGIINGTADGKFNPDAPIKREEIAAMVIRAIEFKDKEKLNGLDTPANFKDHGSIGAFAIDSVYKANALGVVKGTENGSFNPKNNATRAEAAVMLYRALDTLTLIKE
ncbi:S8 family serine peptidase [Sporosarcina sp. OR05]|uniref:S8 family serine peptidase n=1 Tax=Sporosarcina sp. OR05 TaxID=2969819 RepID=UPI00352AC704